MNLSPGLSTRGFFYFSSASPRFRLCNAPKPSVHFAREPHRGENCEAFRFELFQSLAALAGAAATPARTTRLTRAERMVFIFILLDFPSVVVEMGVKRLPPAYGVFCAAEKSVSRMRYEFLTHLLRLVKTKEKFEGVAGSHGHVTEFDPIHGHK